MGPPNDLIIVGRTDSILSFLRNFGYLMTKLEFPMQHHIADGMKIARYIEKYATSLTALRLWFSSTAFASDNRFREDDLYFEYLSYVPNMLRSLPHLRSVELAFYSYDVMMKIYPALTNIDSLTISYPKSILVDQPKSHFKNIRKFTIKSIFFVYYDVREGYEYPFTFDRLESLEIHANSITDFPTHLIFDNTQLKSLAWFGTINASDLLQILDQTKETHRIGTLKLGWNYRMANGEAISLMTNYGSLTRIIFDLDGYENLDLFKESLPFFPDQWHVTDTWTKDLRYGRKYFLIVIERKTNTSISRDLVFDRTAPLENYMD